MARVRQSGFTLIELLVGLIVIGILVAIAVPTYQTAMQKARRGAAQTCLMEVAQVMERAYTTNMTYALTKFPDLGCIDDQVDTYAFSFSGTPDADSYVIQAVPQGSQAGDTQCGTMSIDQAGVKTEGGTATSAEDCW